MKDWLAGIICLFLVSAQGHVFAQEGKKDLLDDLKKSIAGAPVYDLAKRAEIARLGSLIHRYPGTGQLFDHYHGLHKAYADFNFDSAYYYALKMKQVADDGGNKSMITYAAIRLNDVLISAGMFKEVFDSINLLNPEGLGINQKAEYYILRSRAYFELADYDRDSIFSGSYNKAGRVFLDSALQFLTAGSTEYLYYNGLKELKAGNADKAITWFRKLESTPLLPPAFRAFVYPAMSEAYLRKGFTDTAVMLLAEASKAEIGLSIKKSTAITRLADLLNTLGDDENAAFCIKKALMDAAAYCARHRMLRLSSVLPVIEARKHESLRLEKAGITRYARVITVFLVVFLTLSFVIYRQIRSLKAQRKFISEKNLSMRQLLDEKDWLIKEVHHRVKNNLHTITSLLESQSAYLKDDAFKAVRDTQHRVYAMSLIHQKLYHPEKQITKINMPVYLHELINYLSDSFKTSGRIHFKMETEPVELDITLAVPIGMILNEAITNAMKYAFPGDQEGTITVGIRSTAADRVLFYVSDNGTGLPETPDQPGLNTLGIKLMKGLSDDIAAVFNIESGGGTRISIEFGADKSLIYVQRFYTN